MRVPKGVRIFPLVFTILVSALVLACTTQPTATSVPPTATTAPAATDEPAPTGTPAPPAETEEPTPAAEPTTEPTATAVPPTETPAPTAEPTPAPSPTTEPTPGPMAPPEAQAIAQADPADVVSSVLHPENDSGQSGWATLIAQGDQTQVILSLSPGDMESEAVHIHSGQCGPDLGGVVHPLTSFVGGSGFSVTTVPADLASLRNGDFAINTHNVEDASIYTSCANIPTQAQSVSIALNEENDSGQSGVATLTARGVQTDVVLHLSSGDMESQAVHIHSGQCGPDLGGVVHPLTSFMGGAGASVTTLDVPLNSVQTGDFAINTHNADDSSIYTSCGNIPRNMNTLTIPLEEQNESGQSGQALLTPRDGNTEVWLTLSEGNMESSAVHIHSGQCGPDLGSVVHPLTNITEGTSATFLEGVALSSLLTGDFAINTHNAQDSSIYTACGNIPSTDVSIIAEDYSFDVGELVVPAGQTITLSLANQGERSHNIFFASYDELNADNERADRLAPGQTRARQFTFDRPGIYPFYCPVGNGSHLNRGQIGVLRVVGPTETDGEPTLQLNAPSTNTELEGPEILFGASVTNFNLDETDPDSGQMRVSLNGAELESTRSIVGSLENVASAQHTLMAELLNSNGTPLSPPVETSLTFTVEPGSMASGYPTVGPGPAADRRTVVIE